MKKIMNWLLLIALLLSSCTKDLPDIDQDSDGIDVVTNTIIEDKIIENSENVTELITEQINVPTELEDFRELLEGVPEEDVLNYKGYGFFKDEAGNSVVIEYQYSSDGKTRIVAGGKYYFTVPLPSVSDFEKVKEGMNIFEVVELVGLPVRSTTFGMTSLDFLTASEDIYIRIYFKSSEIVGTPSLIVTEVDQREEPKTIE